jgi:hypothetical protein
MQEAKRQGQPARKRRLRTLFVIRRRYRLAGWGAALCGALFAIAFVSVAHQTMIAAGEAPSVGFFIPAIAIIAAAAVGPWIAVRLAWRRSLRRHFWKWQ